MNLALFPLYCLKSFFMASIYSEGQSSEKIKEKGSKDSNAIELFVADAEKRVPIDLTSRGLVFKLSDDETVCVFTEDLKTFILQEKERQIREAKEKDYRFHLKGNPKNSLAAIFR
jgi:hypothetical protein